MNDEENDILPTELRTAAQRAFLLSFWGHQQKLPMALAVTQNLPEFYVSHTSCPVSWLTDLGSSRVGLKGPSNPHIPSEVFVFLSKALRLPKGSAS